MIAHKDSRPCCAQVLFALNLEGNAHGASAEEVERPRDDIIDVEALADEGHGDGDEDAPDGAGGKSRDIEYEAYIVSEARIHRGEVMEDEKRER